MFVSRITMDECYIFAYNSLTDFCNNDHKSLSSRLGILYKRIAFQVEKFKTILNIVPINNEEMHGSMSNVAQNDTKLRSAASKLQTKEYIYEATAI